MAAQLEKTRHPGVYRRGGRYVVAYRDHNGKQRWESAGALEEARKLKAAKDADVARGEFHPASRITFKDYASEWVEHYRGRGRNGFRESTRGYYKSDLKRWVYPFFGERLRLSDITPRHISGLVAHLCEQKGKGGKPLSDSTVRSILNPVRSALACAVEDGLLRSNPAQRVRLPHRQAVEDTDGEEVLALTRKQLATFLKVVHREHRTMFRVLAATGLRASELLALQWWHLHLTGSRPHVKVRRQFYKGRMQPPKSRYGRRDVPLNAALVFELRRRRRDSEWARDEDLVFPSLNGTPLEYSNVFRRVLRPLPKRSACRGVGFHTFRHTTASMLFARGRNAKQVQRWLGHHSAAFTLATYVHLLGDELGDALSLDAELQSANKVQTDPT